MVAAKSRRNTAPIVATVEIKTPTGWQTIQALLDTGARANLISQTRAIELGLVLTDQRAPRLKAANGRPVPTFGVYSQLIRMTDSRGSSLESEELLVAGVIPEYDAMLGTSFLNLHDPDLRCGKQEWYVRPQASRREYVALVEEDAFRQMAEEEGAEVFAIQVEDLRPSSGSDVAMMNLEEATIPEAYQDLADVFSKEKANELPAHGPQDHAIEVQGGSPSFGPLYNCSARELEAIRVYIEENLAKGFIRPSTSPAGAPILFVKKKDGTLRLCVDYRGLNRLTVKNRHPLPLISEALDRLVGAKVYTKLDIRSAYNLIRIKEGDEWKTAFRTRYGHFEYRVMPFGLANAPATFQGHINAVLRDYLDVFCLAYIDDILIFSEREEDHEEHVRKVLERLLAAGLYCKLEKCEFSTRRVGFVGYVITPEGVSMEDDRVATVRDWPAPRSHKEVQIFLGFANFYRRFISKYSKITRPMTDLLLGGKAGKFFGKFEWTPEADRAFKELKEAFTTAPILRHYNPDLPARLETDASGFAIAGILSQPSRTTPGVETEEEDGHWHPVAFWSRTMTVAERNYGTEGTELLAIVMSCKQWRHYLEGARHPTEVRTDHANLQTFMTTKDLRGHQARWWEILSGYNLETVYQPGRYNPADGPSRRPDYMPEPRVETPVSYRLLVAALQYGSPPHTASQQALAGNAKKPRNRRRKKRAGVRTEEERGQSSDQSPLRNPTGADDCKRLVPCHLFAVAAEDETAYGERTEDFTFAVVMITVWPPPGVSPMVGLTPRKRRSEPAQPR